MASGAEALPGHFRTAHWTGGTRPPLQRRYRRAARCPLTSARGSAAARRAWTRAANGRNTANGRRGSRRARQVAADWLFNNPNEFFRLRAGGRAHGGARNPLRGSWRRGTTSACRWRSPAGAPGPMNRAQETPSMCALPSGNGRSMHQVYVRRGCIVALLGLCLCGLAQAQHAAPAGSLPAEASSPGQMPRAWDPLPDRPGLALLIEPTPELAIAVARGSGLWVECVVAPPALEGFRQTIDAAGLYGTRVVARAATGDPMGRQIHYPPSGAHLLWRRSRRLTRTSRPSAGWSTPTASATSPAPAAPPRRRRR